jgi:hypothetical protein
MPSTYFSELNNDSILVLLLDVELFPSAGSDRLPKTSCIMEFSASTCLFSFDFKNSLSSYVTVSFASQFVFFSSAEFPEPLGDSCFIYGVAKMSPAAFF